MEGREREIEGKGCREREREIGMEGGIRGEGDGGRYREREGGKHRVKEEGTWKEG